MKIEVSAAAPPDSTLVVAVTDPPASLPDVAAAVAELVATGEASHERHHARLLRVDGRHVVAAGAGSRDDVDSDALRDAAAAAVLELQTTIGGRAAWLLDPSLAPALGEQAQAVVEGFLLGAYEPGTWKTASSATKPLDELTLVTDADVADTVRCAEIVARWTNYARDLVNRPPNDLTPARFADEVAAVAGDREGLSATSLGPDEMRERGMGALLAVGAGSVNEPRLIVLRYEPAAVQSDVRLGLVGKGMTFDTGGISLKPADRMETMKSDMAGGAAVVAGVAALAELGIPLRAVAIVAAAENMPGGDSYRPGDIITASNGKTIEVTNTDAEGRLVLADALVYAHEDGATHVVDFATLTGIMQRALGDIYAGVFANAPEWRDAVVEAGEASGDHAWPFPMHPRYRRLIDSDFADLKNSSLRGLGGPIYAAHFLEEFAGEGPWAHVDIAGTAFLNWARGDYLSQVGGTGYGVRLIVELARRLSSA